MRERYVRAMDALQRLCLWVCGISLVVVTLIIPWGVYTRYVLGYGSSWPEPMAVLLMIWISFLSGALVYRDHLHIGVMIVPNLLTGAARLALGWIVELCMLATNLFMLVWGTALVETTGSQAIAEFPVWSVGISYLPVPVGRAVTALFVVARLWTQSFFEAPSDESVAAVTTE